MQARTRPGVIFLWLALLLAACGSPTEQTPTATASLPAELTPFLTYTPDATAAPPEAATATPVPPPSPTPRTHTVKAGEDMLGIALRYGVSLTDLQAANPEVDTHMMSIGTVLIIPSTDGEATAQPVVALQTEVVLGTLVCWHVESGGAWCFLPVQNNQDFMVESISARIRIYDADGQETASQVATGVLDVLAPGGLMPLSAYFAPPLPERLQAGAELLTALPLTAESARYLAVSLNDPQVTVAEDGLSAQVSGTVTLDAAEGQANQLWVAAVAYNAAGQVVGVRRWESGAALAAGESLPVTFVVYSVGGRIARVETLAEARP